MTSQILRTGRGRGFGVRNPGKFAYVLYGWPLGIFLCFLNKLINDFRNCGYKLEQNGQVISHQSDLRSCPETRKQSPGVHQVTAQYHVMIAVPAGVLEKKNRVNRKYLYDTINVFNYTNS